jgi:hypothetical protein
MTISSQTTSFLKLEASIASSCLEVAAPCLGFHVPATRSHMSVRCGVSLVYVSSYCSLLRYSRRLCRSISSSSRPDCACLSYVYTLGISGCLTHWVRAISKSTVCTHGCPDSQLQCGMRSTDETASVYRQDCFLNPHGVVCSPSFEEHRA